MGSKVLIVGGGGREHALGWKLKQSKQVTDLYFAPGNAGTAQLGENVSIDQIDKLARFAHDNGIDLTVIGKETFLEEGIVNAFKKRGLSIFGPTKEAALLETNKAWATDFMKRHNIPHPSSLTVKSFDDAYKYIEEQGVERIVIKATGLAGGKGVFLPVTLADAKACLKRIMVDEEFGPCDAVLIQERLSGREISLQAFCDGKTIVPLLGAQDHKRINDNDEGPNTGGMGTFAPCPMDGKLEKEILETILLPTIKGMSDEGHPYEGILYAGLMITDGGPKVIEYNARFGDPETQPLMLLFSGDLYGVLKSCADGNLKRAQVSFRGGAALCVVLASAGYPGKYETGKAIAGLGKGTSDLQIFHAGTKAEDDEFVTGGGRVLGVTAYGKTMGAAREKVYAAIGDDGIHFEGMHFRHDIGKS